MHFVHLNLFLHECFVAKIHSIVAAVELLKEAMTKKIAMHSCCIVRELKEKKVTPSVLKQWEKEGLKLNVLKDDHFIVFCHLMDFFSLQNY